MDKRIEKIREYFREMVSAPTTSVSAGNIAGFPPDDPPVKKKKKYLTLGKNSRSKWLKSLRGK